jgi:hypothetical protein
MDFKTKTATLLLRAAVSLQFLKYFSGVTDALSGATAIAGGHVHGHGVNRSGFEDTGGWRVMESRDLGCVQA